MLSSSTDFLSYVIVMFLLWIYVPYILFRLIAERRVDLGRSQDETWFEEMLNAFLPGILLHLHAAAIYGFLCYRWPTHFSVDMAVMASMFGQNHGAISDYIYDGHWGYCFVYIGLIWSFAIIHGLWFGWAASIVCRLDAGVEGVEYITSPEGWQSVRAQLGEKHRAFVAFLIRCGWRLWGLFLHESIVPLYTWLAHRTYVCVETKSKGMYCGVFVGYEKTTGGAIEAVRLMSVADLSEARDCFEMRTIYLRWKEVVKMSVVPGLENAIADTRHCDAMSAQRPSLVVSAEIGTANTAGERPILLHIQDLPETWRPIRR